MAFRLEIVKIKKNFLIGVSSNGNRYKIKINDVSDKYEIGKMYYFYAKHITRLFSSILIPITREEAGIVL